MKKLIIAAHPDDEVLGCGGTIVRSVKEGDEVRVLFLSSGVGARTQTKHTETDRHIQQARNAGEILGISEILFEDLPDNRFDSVDLLDIVRLIERQVEDFSPEQVFTHHGGDLNLDHSLVFRATLTAVRPMPGCPVKTLYAYEVPSSSEWAMQKLSPVFEPNCFIDIAEYLPVKLKAMEAYESELRGFPHPRSLEGLQALAKRWGTQSGLHAAEPFQIIWSKY